MPLYVLVCHDKPDSLALRMATRSAHLAYAGTFAAKMKLGGPILDAKGDMAGSMMIMDMESLEEAKAFNAEDPYTKAGLFGDVAVFPFRMTLGSLG